jgi:hypothetical protein
MIMGGVLQAAYGRQRRRQKAALQRGDEQLEAFAFMLGFPACAQQLLLVGPAVPGIEDGGAV